MRKLHPFERLYSMPAALTKPHLYRVAGQWHTVAVPSTTYVAGAHTDTGDWVRANLPSTPGNINTGKDSPTLHTAVSRRAARHHG